MQLGIHGGRIPIIAETDKKIPKSAMPLKTLNWTTVPRERIFGTIWENIDEEKLYQQLDLKDVSQHFAIGKASFDETETFNETIRHRFGTTETAISVIEPRRAQNCTIMLSKLRLSNKQIKRAILSMDQYGELPRDMIEQARLFYLKFMLKFMPTKDETQKLRETVEKYKTASILPIADRFLYEISNILRYEQRLRCLHIISTFRERIDDVSRSIEVITSASIAVTSSNRLKQLLRLILALGNFLNRGKRSGNAYGTALFNFLHFFPF
ncbi:unnamed protein product [Gongylonema pulchrum]|uniref:FH2 domain-containing protein n=1 Tax=Gongylonema pulchrum TaxID=637853 RepID=A0A183E888_9BILA|nr:unnamed protein product [Gongylonema pulchrum]